MKGRWNNVYVLKTGNEGSYATASAKNRKEAREVFHAGLNQYIPSQEIIIQNFVPSKIQRAGETLAPKKLIRLVLDGKTLFE